MTRQEMFEKAVRGLSKQGWVQAKDGKFCTYQDKAGRRCAWGHVDLSLNSAHPPIGLLWEDRLGLFKDIKDSEESYKVYRFGKTMQHTHDESKSPEGMLRDFRNLAERCSLTWPEDVPKEL